METKHRRWVAVVAFLFATLMLISLPCAAAEFTADMTINSAGRAMQGKIFVKGTRYRQEMNVMGQEQVMIFHGEKKTGWMLMPAMRMYMPIPDYGPSSSAVTDQEELDKNATRRYLGEEKINGYQCKKYRYVFKDSSAGKMTQWISSRLQYPIKMIIEDRGGNMVREISNIKETNLSNALFELPSGYRKISMPGMPKMGGMPGANQ